MKSNQTQSTFAARCLMGLLVLVAAFGGMIAVPGCGESSADESEGGEGYKVVATIGMVSDLVERVAGDRAQVELLIEAGIDPHLYAAKRSDIATLLDADVIFYSGLMLEGKMSDALVRAATAGKKVYPVTELLDNEYLLEPDDFEGHYDPHVWNDPIAWSKAVEVIQAKLTEYDPAGEEVYAANAAALIEEIEALDAYAKEVLASVPENSRVLATEHDAFNYFGKRYGYEVVGVQGISTNSEAGVKDVENMVKLLVDQKVGAVFVESTNSGRGIKSVIDGAKAQGHSVVVGGELFSDAMGEPGTYRGTYIGMIDHNVTLIVRGLGGDAPEGGMQGKLTGEE